MCWAWGHRSSDVIDRLTVKAALAVSVQCPKTLGGYCAAFPGLDIRAARMPAAESSERPLIISVVSHWSLGAAPICCFERILAETVVRGVAGDRASMFSWANRR